MTTFSSSHDDGWLPADIDLGQIFIARDDQLDLFSFYLDRWLRDMLTTPSSPNRCAPSPNERIQGLVVLLYGRGGFGKSTLLTHYHDLARAHPKKFLVSEIVDWEFAVEGKRHLFHVPKEQDVDAVEYFLLLCDRLAHALGKQANDFKEYQKALKTIKEAKKQVSSELERLKGDDRYAWMRKLAGEELIAVLRQFVPPLGPILDNQTIAGTIKEGMDMGLQATQQQLGLLTIRLREKMGQNLDDSLDPSLRLGFALGEDLAHWSRNFPLLIFFDTYEEVDEADTLLRLVMGAAGTRIGWVLAGRDNLWAGIGQRRRTQSKSYGYKEIATPGRALAIDFNAGGVGAFTRTDVLEYFTQLVERLPSEASLSALTEDEAQQIMEVTRGVPLAIKIAAGLYLETADIRVVSQKGESAREIVDTLVERYLLHTRDDQWERVRLYGLALLRRPDYPPAVAAALGLTPQQAVTNYEQELSRLQRRYSFIFTEKVQPTLHQEVRHFLRLWLLDRRTNPQILAINKVLVQTHVTAMSLLEKQRAYQSLEERLRDEEWVSLYLDLTEQQFWLEPSEGVHLCLPFIVAATSYQRALTSDAARIGTFFEVQIKQPFRAWWELTIHSLTSGQDHNQSGKRFTELTELANLVSQHNLAFPSPLPGFRAELEAILWWRLAEAHVGKDDRDALVWYEKALTRLSQEKELKNAATWTYIKVSDQLFFHERKNEEALYFLNKAIELSPHDVNAYLKRADTYCVMRQYELAFVDCEKALSLNPNSAEAYTYRGNIHRRLRQFEQALNDYSQALSLSSDSLGFAHAWTYLHRGHAYRAMKQYEQAIADYTQTISLEPVRDDHRLSIHAYLHRGHAYRAMKQYEQAIADYTQTIPFSPNGSFDRGLTYLYLKMHEQACADFARYATLHPRDVNAAWMIVYASLSKQRPGAEMAKRLEEIALLDPKSDEACVCRGVALGLRGKLREGLGELEQALQLDPKSEDAFFWKGMICAYLGHSTVAMESIEQALQAELPPLLLTPLYWLEQDRPQFFHEYAKPLLERYEIH